MPVDQKQVLFLGNCFLETCFVFNMIGEESRFIFSKVPPWFKLKVVCDESSFLFFKVIGDGAEPRLLRRTIVRSRDLIKVTSSLPIFIKSYDSFYYSQESQCHAVNLKCQWVIFVKLLIKTAINNEYVEKAASENAIHLNSLNIKRQWIIFWKAPIME